MTLPCCGQGIQAGLKFGVPLTQYFETGANGGLQRNAVYSAATRRYLAGAAVEWDPARSFGIELEAIYRRMGYVGIVEFFDRGAFQRSSIDVKGNSWDFPVMAKYHFPRSPRLFVEGGPVLRYVGPVRGRGEETDGSLVTGTSTTVALDTPEPSELRKRWYPGLAAGGGVELSAGRVRIAPEFRYTRWTANIAGEGGLLRFSPNQVDINIGVWF